MSYEEQLFNEVIYVAAGKLSPSDSVDLLEWVESLEVAKRKADEYEAKAKAFDEICKAHVPLEKRMSPVTIDEGLDFAEETEEIILKYYESGEPNEL